MTNDRSHFSKLWIATTPPQRSKIRLLNCYNKTPKEPETLVPSSHCYPFSGWKILNTWNNCLPRQCEHKTSNFTFRNIFKVLMCWLTLKKHTYFLKLTFRFKSPPPMPPPVLMNFVVFPPGCGDSVPELWGWGAHEAQLSCPDVVSGDMYMKMRHQDGSLSISLLTTQTMFTMGFFP